MRPWSCNAVSASRTGVRLTFRAAASLSSESASPSAKRPSTIASRIRSVTSAGEGARRPCRPGRRRSAWAAPCGGRRADGLGTFARMRFAGPRAGGPAPRRRGWPRGPCAAARSRRGRARRATAPRSNSSSATAVTGSSIRVGTTRSIVATSQRSLPFHSIGEFARPAPRRSCRRWIVTFGLVFERADLEAARPHADVGHELAGRLDQDDLDALLREHAARSPRRGCRRRSPARARCRRAAGAGSRRGRRPGCRGCRGWPAGQASNRSRR